MTEDTTDSWAKKSWCVKEKFRKITSCICTPVVKFSFWVSVMVKRWKDVCTNDWNFVCIVVLPVGPFFLFNFVYQVSMLKSQCDHSEELHSMKSKLMLYDELFWMHGRGPFFFEQKKLYFLRMPKRLVPNWQCAFSEPWRVIMIVWVDVFVLAGTLVLVALQVAVIWIKFI